MRYASPPAYALCVMMIFSSGVANAQDNAFWQRALNFVDTFILSGQHDAQWRRCHDRIVDLFNAASTESTGGKVGLSFKDIQAELKVLVNKNEPNPVIAQSILKSYSGNAKIFLFACLSVGTDDQLFRDILLELVNVDVRRARQQDAGGCIMRDGKIGSMFVTLVKRPPASETMIPPNSAPILFNPNTNKGRMKDQVTDGTIGEFGDLNIEVECR